MTTHRFEPDAFAPIDGCSLETYAEMCRALVRAPGASARQLETALAERSLTPTAWAAIRAGWAARIARDPYVRGAFRRLYLGEDAASPSPTVAHPFIQEGDPA